MNDFEVKRQRLNDHLAQHGLRHTQQRDVILGEFLRRHEHVTVEDLWHRVRKVDPAIGYATVYRTLKLFTECGIAYKREFGDAGARYEGTTEHHHDHMICTRCGKIIEFENEAIERLQEKVCRERSFQMRSHKMELYGLCQKCQRKKKSS